MKPLPGLCAAILLFLAGPAPLYAAGNGFPEAIARARPAIVGIGTFQKTRRPPARLLGTGFGVRDGRHVLTNLHVIPNRIETERGEFLTVMVGTGSDPEFRPARVVASDRRHDLALLRFDGAPIPVLELAQPSTVREGELFLFTGYPIGAVLGLYPATHRAMVAAITPVVIPADHSGQLDAAAVRRLRAPYTVYQLDGTAYPGNSGSPLYEPEGGRVVGIVNKVLVKESREAVLSDPSGISYAIPIEHARRLIQQALTPRD